MNDTIETLEQEHGLENIRDLAKDLIGNGFAIEDVIEAVEAVLEDDDTDAAELDEALGGLIGFGLRPNGVCDSLESNFLDDEESIEQLLSEELDIEELSGGDMGDLRFKVIENQDSEHLEEMAVVGNEDGSNLFKVWEHDESPFNGSDGLEEGETYRAENVVGDEYNGDVTIQTTQYSSITEIDADIEVDDSADLEFDELMIQSVVSDKSGLVRRCPEDDCGRPVKNGKCSEHNAVDPVFDLRAVVMTEDGKLYIHRDELESLTGFTLDDAKALFKEKLDEDAVTRKVDSLLNGEVLEGSADEAYGSFHANALEFATLDTTSEASDLLEAHGD